MVTHPLISYCQCIHTIAASYSDPTLLILLMHTAAACMLRLSVDETEDCTYVLGALAISAIDERVGGGVGVQADAAGNKKGNLSSWQVQCSTLAELI